MINWDDRSTDVLLNPRLTPDDRAVAERLIGACGKLEAHVWLTTSGSTGRLRPVALAKQALLTAADAVNRHLEADGSDVWCRAIPAFHVGGLGIHARAHRSGARVVTLEKWNPVHFHELLADETATLTSLVPAQLRDLLAEGLAAPPLLRAVLLGGGATSTELWRAARQLGWPILPNYGATESGAQVATAALDDLDMDDVPPLRLLTHVEGKVTGDGRLAFRGPSLLTGYATEEGLVDPKVDGWWITEDLGTIASGVVTVAGRIGDLIKVGGESVSLEALQIRLDELRGGGIPGVTDAAVTSRDDDRLGKVVVLAVAGTAKGAEELRKRYDASVLPFERAREMKLVERIARTELGKVIRTHLA